MPSYNCYDVTFYTCSLYFVNGKNKQTTKTVTKLAKITFKTQSKFFFFIIKLKPSKAFVGKIIFELRYYVKITTNILLKSQISS